MTMTHSSSATARRRSPVEVSGPCPEVNVGGRLPRDEAVETKERIRQIRDGLEDLTRRMEALTKRVDALPGYGTVVAAAIAMHLATFALIGIGVAIVYLWRGLNG